MLAEGLAAMSLRDDSGGVPDLFGGLEEKQR